jgi:hypothetical protein
MITKLSRITGTATNGGPLRASWIRARPPDFPHAIMPSWGQSSRFGLDFEGPDFVEWSVRRNLRIDI